MNHELEKAVLSCILLDSSLINKLIINEECFLDDTYKFIFKLLLKQYNDFKTIDAVGLIQNYKNEFNSKFTESRIIERITELYSEIAVTTNFEYYQQSLFSTYIDHQIMSSIDSFKQQKITKDELLLDIHKFENMGIKTDKNRLSSEEIFRIINSQNQRIRFRFSKLSEKANIQEHDLVIIAARTGIGKSGFCLNLLENLSDKYNCLYFNMEIAEKQIYQRLISINTGIAMKYLDDCQTNYQKESILKGCDNLSKKKIKIFNQAQTVANMRRIIINESKNEHTIVFIDHVGLIIPQKNTTIYENLTAITKELRQISLNYNCTIILVSQLNRNADDDSIPKISDLKDSGELEQSATTVILLHEPNRENNIRSSKVKITLFIGKNRNGSLGKCDYEYNKENQRFEEMENKNGKN